VQHVFGSWLERVERELTPERIPWPSKYSLSHCRPTPLWLVSSCTGHRILLQHLRSHSHQVQQRHCPNIRRFRGVRRFFKVTVL
jgi:hypothetical protein